MFIVHTCLLMALATGGPGDRVGDPPAQIEVVVKPHALVRGTVVTLGELADILPAGTEAYELSKVVFGKPPIAGFSRTVTRNELLQSLVMAGHNAGRFIFKGSREVVVQPVFTDLPMQEVLEAADTALRAILESEPRSDVEYELSSTVRRMRVPPGRRSLDLRARVRNGQTNASSAIVDVQILVDGEPYKVLPLQYRLDRYQQVLKTSRSIRRGSPLGGDNLVLSREKVSQTTGLYVQSLDDVRGMIARRNLQGKRLLTLSDIGEPALIRRGELVTVIVTTGRIKVTTKALANHDAARGEVVSLVNLRSKQPLTGIAYAPGTVVVPTAR